jgi:dienelactone hydrolase
MKKYALYLCAAMVLAACNSNNNDTKAHTPAVKMEAVGYTADTAALTSYVAYDSAVATKRPVILVVHEWWGLNDYIKNRAKQLAALGYIAMAVDMYGNGKMGATPDAANALATPFYANPVFAKSRFDAALAQIKKWPQADTNNIAAIGYCFGGSMVLNIAKLGDKLNGVVSFHGGLAGMPADKNLLQAKVLVCHGKDDKFVSKEEIAGFKKQMDSIGAVYTFKEYAGATHAFSNPEATAWGQKFNIPIAYNATADTASWQEMQVFFKSIFK